MKGCELPKFMLAPQNLARRAPLLGPHDATVGIAILSVYIRTLAYQSFGYSPAPKGRASRSWSCLPLASCLSREPPRELPVLNKLGS